VLEIDDHFEAVVLKELDGLGGHEQVFFGSGFEGAGYVEKAGFDDDDGDRNALAVGEHELDVSPIGDACAAAARSAEEGQLHGSGIDIGEGGGEIGDKMVCAGETDLSVLDSEGGHALKKPDSIGNGDFEVWLLQPVAEAGIEQLHPFHAQIVQQTQLPAVSAAAGA
jgi:hypothetical protein